MMTEMMRAKLVKKNLTGTNLKYKKVMMRSIQKIQSKKVKAEAL